MKKYFVFSDICRILHPVFVRLKYIIMKICSLFCLLWVVSSSLFAQHSLENRLNMYRADDEIIKQQVEYKDPGRGGENVLWDFSRLTSVNDEYRLSFFEAYNGKLAGMEHQTMYYYTLSNDSLLLWGFENATAKLKNDQPELLLKYPVKYQDHTSCYYHGHGLYCDRLAADSTLIAVETFRWYSKGYRYPVFETVFSFLPRHIIIWRKMRKIFDMVHTRLTSRKLCPYFLEVRPVCP